MKSEGTFKGDRDEMVTETGGQQCVITVDKGKKHSVFSKEHKPNKFLYSSESPERMLHKEFWP